MLCIVVDRNRKSDKQQAYDAYAQMSIPDGSSSGMMVPGRANHNDVHLYNRIPTSLQQEDGHDMVQLLRDVISINDLPKSLQQQPQGGIKPPHPAAAAGTAINTNYAKSLASAATNISEKTMGVAADLPNWYQRASMEDLRHGLTNRAKFERSVRPCEFVGNSTGYHSHMSISRVGAGAEAGAAAGVAALGAYNDDELMDEATNVFMENEADRGVDFLSQQQMNARRDGGGLLHVGNIAQSHTQPHTQPHTLLSNSEAMYSNPSRMANCHVGEPALGRHLSNELFDTPSSVPHSHSLTDTSTVQQSYYQTTSAATHNHHYSDTAAVSSPSDQQQQQSPHHSVKSTSPPNGFGGGANAGSVSNSASSQQMFYHSSDNYNSSPSSGSTASAPEYRPYEVSSQSTQLSMGGGGDLRMMPEVSSCHNMLTDGTGEQSSPHQVYSPTHNHQHGNFSGARSGEDTPSSGLVSCLLCLLLLDPFLNISQYMYRWILKKC